MSHPGSFFWDLRACFLRHRYARKSVSVPVSVSVPDGIDTGCSMFDPPTHPVASPASGCHPDRSRRRSGGIYGLLRANRFRQLPHRLVLSERSDSNRFSTRPPASLPMTSSTLPRSSRIGRANLTSTRAGYIPPLHPHFGTVCRGGIYAALVARSESPITSPLFVIIRFVGPQ
jgi:hypothetical protein